MKYSCVICGKQELCKDTIGINKKLLGTDIANYYNYWTRSKNSKPKAANCFCEMMR